MASDDLRARLAEDERDRWKSWAAKQEARALKAEAALAEYEHVRASVTAGEPLGRALTVSEVLEQHEVTRKELIHELGEGLHLNWRQVIAATGRMRRAAFDWMKDFEQAKAERDRAEKELGDWRTAAYQASRERDNARVACRSTAVLLRAVADRGGNVGALLAAADDLDDVASDRPWLTNPPEPCSPVACDPCPICKPTTIEES